MTQDDPGPLEVNSYLEGTEFPVDRRDLVEVAKDNDAPRAVVETLRSLPDIEYFQAPDVMRALAKQR